MIKEELIKEMTRQTGLERPVVVDFMKRLRQLVIDTLRYGEDIQLWPGFHIEAILVPDTEVYDPTKVCKQIVPEHYMYKAKLSRRFKDNIRGGTLNELKRQREQKEEDADD